ncbi:hypothetical protein P9222_24045 [Paenibacillus amylolyticus]|nr:hypothetical protein [Paenibacillus amylolyticus]WFR61476.1 hypothetical protein P9222_24045 [Paenibacillus amylolyticus]
MVNLKKCTIFTVIAALMFMVLGSAAPKHLLPQDFMSAETSYMIPQANLLS